MNDSNAVCPVRQLSVDKEFRELIPPLSSEESSRRDARFFRGTVLERADAHCEACSVFTGQITEVHHIKPVSRSGNGYPANLIALCPNCHRWITAYINYRNDIRVQDVELSIDRVYSRDVARFLLDLAEGQVVLCEGDEWRGGCIR